MYRIYGIDRRTMERVWEGEASPPRSLSHLLTKARDWNYITVHSPVINGFVVYEVERINNDPR